MGYACLASPLFLGDLVRLSPDRIVDTSRQKISDKGKLTDPGILNFWLHSELVSIDWVDQVMTLILDVEARISDDAFKTLNGDLSLVNLHEFADNPRVLARDAKDSFVDRSGQDMVVRQLAGQLFLTDLLVPAKRHVPGWEAEEYLSL